MTYGICLWTDDDSENDVENSQGEEFMFISMFNVNNREKKCALRLVNSTFRWNKSPQGTTIGIVCWTVENNYWNVHFLRSHKALIFFDVL